MKIVQEHKEVVSERGFDYISTYQKGELTIDKGLLVQTNGLYLRVECPYCKIEYDVATRHFKNGTNCSHCCNKYENSFAYHIEKELNAPLDKYWDFEKNKDNPYTISRCRNGKKKNGDNLKVWIKCAETDYHASYEVSCNNFVKGKRCPYCSNQKIHPKDSIIQWGIDNVDKDFESKYIGDNNTLDLWTIAPKTDTKIWFKCQEVDYHDEYKMACCEFVYKTDKYKCPQCNSKSENIHYNDSFEGKHPKKAKYWDYEKNELLPSEVTPMTHKEYWFKCELCGNSVFKRVGHVTKSNAGITCKSCCSSEGEKLIRDYLEDKGFIDRVDYFHDKEYFKDLKGIKGGILRPDFIFPKYKIWIEFDGGQHKEFVPWMHRTYDNFIMQQKNDESKNKYAIRNGWNLIRIEEDEKDNIEEILNNTFKEIV